MTKNLSLRFFEDFVNFLPTFRRKIDSFEISFSITLKNYQMRRVTPNRYALDRKHFRVRIFHPVDDHFYSILNLEQISTYRKLYFFKNKPQQTEFQWSKFHRSSKYFWFLLAKNFSFERKRVELAWF